MDTTIKIVRQRIVKTWNADGSECEFRYFDYDGEGKRQGATAGIEPVIFYRKEISAENFEEAFRHGVEQKIGDAAALGQKVPLAMRRAEMEEVALRISKADGAWNLKGKAATPESMLAKLAAMGYDVSGVKEIIPKS